ncbi:uncharacterized protein [Palaemon carinicauda]|uniref:uncharacterized protein isoform X1 n=1 Tax=Palaemon carinicauda TaxID=392227 RepID=UPI0035B66AEE
MAWLRENLLIWAPHALPYLMATVLIGLFITWYTKRKQMVAMIEKIPGPPAWPIIGNALDINVEPREVFICINALVSIGDPMARVWLGPRPMVVTSTCKQAEIQEVGLQNAYTHDDGRYKFLRKVMTLPFLPEADIGPVFERLSRQSTTAQLQTIMQYMSRTWIHNSLWPTSSWSIFYQSLCTNNDIEGWHNRLNKRAAGRCNLQFYLLISLLHKEAKLTLIYMRLVSEKKNYEGSKGKNIDTYRIEYLLFWRNT